MSNKKLYREIGEIDEVLIEEALIVSKKGSQKKSWIKLLSQVASIALIVGCIVISIPLITGKNRVIELTLSRGNIKVYYTDNAPSLSQFNDLVPLTENEIFTKCNTTIFKGNIIEIKNIIINFNGIKQYKAIAKIKVIKTFRGNCSENDILSVVLPAAVNNNIWSEDNETVSLMREGMTGIFMPVQYDENSFLSRNGSTLYWKDIADYGLVDGARFAFLQTDNGLIFSNRDYPSISNMKSLDDIEKYIESMIN